MNRRSLLVALFACSLVSCSSGQPTTPSVTIAGQRVTVGCGMCKFKMPSNGGCYWAAEWNGEHYIVQGNTPTDHQNHAPEGMCNITRTAVIDGTIEGKNLFAKRFELLPPENIPDSPEYTPADLHQPGK